MSFFLNMDVAGKPSAPRQRALCPPTPSTLCQTLCPTTLSSKPMPPRRGSRASKRPNTTRKRGESDPNEPPKKRKTRQSKGGSDDDSKVDSDGDPKVDSDDERKTANKPAKRVQKGR
jgi:hypothetical protein